MKFVNFSIAKKLKEKGFPQSPDYFNYSSYYDWDGLRKIHSLSNASVWFDPNISRDNIYFAPTVSQVLEWLRKERGYNVNMRIYSPDRWYWTIQDREGNPCRSHLTLSDDLFETYEDAALAGIEYTLDNFIT